MCFVIAPNLSRGPDERDVLITVIIVIAHLEEDDEGVGLREGEEEEGEEGGDSAVEDGRAHLLQGVGGPLLARACNRRWMNTTQTAKVGIDLYN